MCLGSRLVCASQEITLEMDFVISWWDEVIRLYALRKQKCSGGNSSEQLKVVDHSFLDSIWKPDIFIGISALWPAEHFLRSFKSKCMDLQIIWSA